MERNNQMNKPNHRQTNIGGFAILLALGGGAFYLCRFLAGVFASLDFQVGIVTSVAALVVLLSAVVIASAIKRVKRAESIPPLSGERAALYDRIFRAWSVLLAEDRHLTDEALRSLKAEMSALESGLGLIASPEVIKAYLALRGAKGGSPTQNGELRTQLGRLLVAMRRDLGASAPDLDENELLTVFLSEANPSAHAVDQPAGSSLARGPEDLRPRVSLAVHR
jgi:hypothetical protein